MKLPLQNPGASRSGSRPLSSAVPVEAAGVIPSGVCGTGWNEPWVRDSYGKANFTDACAAHDACYGACGSAKDSCDESFHRTLRSECARAYGGRWEAAQRRLCNELANSYHSSVHRMGGDAYRAAQRESGCT